MPVKAIAAFAFLIGFALLGTYVLIGVCICVVASILVAVFFSKTRSKHEQVHFEWGMFKGTATVNYVDQSVEWIDGDIPARGKESIKESLEPESIYRCRQQDS